MGYQRALVSQPLAVSTSQRFQRAPTPIPVGVSYRQLNPGSNFLFKRSDASQYGSYPARHAATNSSTAEPSPKEGWWTKDIPANMTHVTTVQELVDELGEAAKLDQLVVLDVFAPWCGACKALFPKLKKLCGEHEDVKFIAMNFEENRKLARALGIKVLPYFHFYRGPSGRVGHMTASIGKIKQLREAIDIHKSDRCYLKDDEAVYLPEFPSIHPKQDDDSGQASDSEQASVLASM